MFCKIFERGKIEFKFRLLVVDVVNWDKIKIIYFYIFKEIVFKLFWFGVIKLFLGFYFWINVKRCKNRKILFCNDIFKVKKYCDCGWGYLYYKL